MEDEEFQPVDEQAVRTLHDELLPVLSFCDNVRTGLLGVSVKEYQELPAYVVPVWNIYNKISEEYRNANEHRNKDR